MGTIEDLHRALATARALAQRIAVLQRLPANVSEERLTQALSRTGECTAALCAALTQDVLRELSVRRAPRRWFALGPYRAASAHALCLHVAGELGAEHGSEGNEVPNIVGTLDVPRLLEALEDEHARTTKALENEHARAREAARSARALDMINAADLRGPKRGPARARRKHVTHQEANTVFRRHPDATNAELAKLLGVTRSTLSRGWLKDALAIHRQARAGHFPRVVEGDEPHG